MLPAYSNHQIYKCYCRLPWFPRQQIWLCWAACRRPQFVGRVSTEPRGSGGIGWIRSNPKAPQGPQGPPRPPKAPNAFSHILTYSDMLGKVKGEGVWSRTIAIGVQEIHHCVASYRLRSALDKPGSKVLPWELCVALRWWLCSRKVGETHDFLPYPPVCTAEWLFNTTSQAKPISCFSAPFLVFR